MLRRGARDGVVAAPALDRLASAVGLFADGKYGAGWNATDGALDGTGEGIKGLFYGGGTGQLQAQLAGAITIIVVFGALSFAFFKITNAIWPGGIRSDEEDEVVGLDLPEMGVLAYPEFTGHEISAVVVTEPVVLEPTAGS